jgi:hypothetical protein
MTLRELSEKIVDTVLSVRLREESVIAVEEIIKNPAGVRAENPSESAAVNTAGKNPRIIDFPVMHL